MNIKLSKSEVLALCRLCTRPASASQLSQKLGSEASSVSRTIAALKEKGLIDIDKAGTTKTIRLSMASHAQRFKLLYDSRPNAKIEKWLSGYAMDILISISDGADTGRILKDAGCSRNTLYKMLKAMGGAGVLFWKGGQVKISDSMLKEFATAYADSLQLLIQQQVKGHNISIRVRKNVVLRTDAKEAPAFFAKTGTKALARKGLEALLTSYDDYYFNLNQKKRELSLEECFAHSLLLASLKSHSDMPALTIFFAKNKRKLNLRALKTFAKEYMVEGALDEVRQKTGFYERMREDARAA
ncbi:MAG: winged helix-turn-helix domain-containing protein [Candidatus Micrarchaeota archaeon]